MRKRIRLTPIEGYNFANTDFRINKEGGLYKKRNSFKEGSYGGSRRGAILEKKQKVRNKRNVDIEKLLQEYRESKDMDMRLISQLWDTAHYNAKHGDSTLLDSLQAEKKAREYRKFEAKIIRKKKEAKEKSLKENKLRLKSIYLALPQGAKIYKDNLNTKYLDPA